jgi:NADH/NAD ratio-sensing transcriptional regulator Rex
MISTLDLFEALKPTMGEANAKLFIQKLEQSEVLVDVKIEKAATAVDIKMEKAFEVQEKIYENDIKSLREFIDDKFATKNDILLLREDLAKLHGGLIGAIANSRADTIKWSFIFWVSEVTILASLIIAFFKLK